MGGYAWVTLATNDTYSLGALVLGHSLHRVGTKYELVVMVTPGVTAKMRERLASVFTLVQEVNILDSKDEANLALLARPELGITFTKLHCWRLTQYDKCVFVDADALVVRNCDELFEREELSAAPDVGWPDSFNSGVFVFKPSLETFASIATFAATKGSFDGGDQGLLNMYFSDWATKDISKHLPFLYNMCSTATYSYLPAYKQYGADVRIIHFVGLTKPWLQYFDTLTGTVQPLAESKHLQALLQLWWDIFCERVHPKLLSSMATISTLAPIQHDFPFFSNQSSSLKKFSVTDDTYNDVYSQTPDFSEFKDPWKKYRSEDKSFVDNTVLDKKNVKCHCGVDVLSLLHCEKKKAKNSITPQFQDNNQHSSKNQSYSSAELVSQEYIIRLDPNRRKDLSCSPSQLLCHQLNIHDDDRERAIFSLHNKNHNAEDALLQYNLHMQRIQHEHNYHQKQQQQRHLNKLEQYMAEICRLDNCTNHADQKHFVDSVDDADTVGSVRYERHTQHGTHHDSQVIHQHVGSNIVLNNDSHAQHTIPDNCAVNSKNQSKPDDLTSCCQCKNKEQSPQVTNTQTDIQRAGSGFFSIPVSYTDPYKVRSILNTMEHPKNANTGIAGAFSQMTLGGPKSASQIALEEHVRKHRWEQGEIDYMGRDSFDNIWKKINETISVTQESSTLPKEIDARKSEDSNITVETSQTIGSEDAKDEKPVVKAGDTMQEQHLVSKTPEEMTCKITDRDVIAMEAQKDKMPTLPLECITDIAITTKISTDSMVAAAEDVYTIKSTDAKLCDTNTGMLLSNSPIELPEATTEPCKLVSPSKPEAPSLDRNLIEISSAQLNIEDSESLQTSSCLLADTVKSPMQEVTSITPVTPTDSVSTRTEVKLEASVPTAQDIIHPTITSINVDSTLQKDIAVSPVQSEITAQDIAKQIIGLSSDVTKSLTIDSEMGSEKHADVLSAATEISTVSPVPIQVAESVLQAEPKESILGTATTVTDKVIASTVTAVRESMEIPRAESGDAMQLNGSTCEVEKQIADVSLSTILSKTVDTTTELMKKQESDSTVIKDIPSRMQLAGEEKIDKDILLPEISSTKELSEKLMESIEQATKMASVPITKAETPETKISEQSMKITLPAAAAEPIEVIAKSKITETIAKPGTTEIITKPETREIITKEAEVKPLESTKQMTTEVSEEATASDESPSEVPESPSIEDPPSPIEAKPLNIPSTPTVTEATPPTSPSVEGAQEMENQDKVAKKSLKKSDSADGTDGDGAEKKAAKKTVKKVTKKQKSKSEEAPATEGSPESLQTKSKKTIKAVKKTGAKTGQTLETETTVPETPPPSTSDAPVPPKRKTKGTTGSKGTTGKKSEMEE